MSDAALMEATRLAPAGRACSKFIWQQCRFQKNWAVRVLPRSGRPAFFVVPKLWQGRSRIGARRWKSDFDLGVPLPNPLSGRFGAPARFDRTIMRRPNDATENGPDPGGLRRRALATLSPRLGVTSGGWKAAARRASATAIHALRRSAALARALDFGSPGPEFFSEFETKQGQ
jgi:hypothetical protein